MKTYNQFLNTPFSEEVNPPEPQGDDPTIKSKEKRQKQIKKMVLLKKLQAVRAGAGADIVKKKGDTSKSDDRYAYESYGGEPIQGEGTKGKTKKEIKDLKKAAETGKGKYVAKADKVES